MFLSRFLFSNKGQSVVEFSLILAFVAVISYGAIKTGILDSLRGLYPPAEKVLYAVDHYRSYDVPLVISDIESIQANGNYSEGGGANRMEYTRGVIRSGWVEKFEEDYNLSEIKNLRDEVGATQWSYLNGVGSAYKDEPTYGNYYRGDVGLYWTTETLRMSTLTAHSTSEGYNYSNELVLQYFYSTKTKKYYVIKNYVWVNQGDTVNHIALTGLHILSNKPSGYFVEGCYEGFDTLAEAKELFERVRSENGYSVIFTMDSLKETDLFAGDYLLVGDEYVKQ